MKRILYLGNKLEKHGATPTSVDILPKLLQSEDICFKAISSFQNKFLRAIHMFLNVLKNYRSKDLVLIDTYSTQNFWYAVICGKLCSILSIPYIFILHGGNLPERFDSASTKILNLFKGARANVVPSDYLRDRLSKFQFENIVFIPNSIDLKLYKFKERDTLKPRLLWVRAFDKVYNPMMAIEVLEILSVKYPNAEVCMVGPDKDGSLNEVKEVAREKDLNCQFKGKLSKDEWIKLSEEYDIFINTTLIDNTPVSVIEAMALGLPIVSTNVGGIPYLISNEENGLLVEPRDSEAMAKDIIRLIENPELAESLSNQGRLKAEKFNWPEVKQLWLQLLG